MPAISILSAHLVNKISAGEVIERPASVVKELVENAIDAGASSIDITVEDGGRRMISVSDNGSGMGADDLAMTFLPHSTSKITEEADLFNIRTMGFRGEALASISAVAHVHAVTRLRDSQDNAGWEIRAEGETISPVRPATASSSGTTITVRDLFFNTPGRRKFMRTANTEFGHIVVQLTRLALPNCNVAFSLTHNGRVVHSLAENQPLRSRIAELLGAELAQSLIELNSRENTAKITGLIAPPHQARTSTRWQYFFVNGRYVRDRLLAHALREAYRGMIEPSRSPAAIIFMEVDTSEIDVNVHPTKIEVRFRNGQFVHSQLLAALRETLNKADITPPVDIVPADRPDDGRRESLKQAMAEFFKSGPEAANHRGPVFEPARAGQYAPADFRQTPTTSQEYAGAPQHRQTATQVEQTFRPTGRSTRRALQIHNAYIVTATNDGLAIIDQHALHERIIFDELKNRLPEGKLASQRLLIPETVEVGQADKTVLSERADMLERFGLDISEFGPGSVAVHALPSLLVERHVSPVEFVRDLIETLAEHHSASGDELLDRILATMACKAAVKAGESLTDDEIDSLLARREEAEKIASCPHGRPTTLKLTLAELEKQFKRI
ncbi:MAG: DNA mismatch repair endonuclease MutL [Planctomycetota bacterium]|nr:DNA mismatch repair endonuclease MutL [Planctomycetota bacterium]